MTNTQEQVTGSTGTRKLRARIFMAKALALFAGIFVVEIRQDLQQYAGNNIPGNKLEVIGRIIVVYDGLA